MYRSYFSVVTIVFLSGCAGIDTGRWSDASSDVLVRTGDVIEAIVTQPEHEPYESQRQALFDQPYIDPLTDYLKEHGNDPDRELVLRQIEKERDRRCLAIAEDYSGEPATEQTLARYRAGYQYSCPAEVKAFAERVQQDQPQEPPATAVVTESNEKGSGPEKAPEQSLGDCYLLTTIRNYSAARDACRESAESGDSRSQANMAMIAHAFEDYASALEWARKAAPASSRASFLLGQMYASGRGVEQNSEQAVYWYDMAANQGHEEARIALERYRGPTPADGT